MESARARDEGSRERERERERERAIINTELGLGAVDCGPSHRGLVT